MSEYHASSETPAAPIPCADCVSPLILGGRRWWGRRWWWVYGNHRGASGVDEASPESPPGGTAPGSPVKAKGSAGAWSPVSASCSSCVPSSKANGTFAWAAGTISLTDSRYRRTAPAANLNCSNLDRSVALIFRFVLSSFRLGVWSFGRFVLPCFCFGA